MIATILRHGEAGSAATDAQRKLTPVGERDIGCAANAFMGACESRGIAAPTLILHSPWLRTRETAKIFAAANPAANLEVQDSLAPERGLSAVIETLSLLPSLLPEPAHVVLVSHQPLVSQLADYLLGFPNSIPPLPPGGWVTIDMAVPARDCGTTVLWAVPPQYGVNR
jgi:phosphohistidine phosphatase